MGFYSFYKILKDMIRTLFGKNVLKILIIIILIIGVIFIYNECFALSTIPPISVDGVTFNFNSAWNDDHPSYVGSMDNIVILRFEVSTNKYYYVFTRSSYPVYISTSTSGSYKITNIHSYDNNNQQTYFAYNSVNTARTSTNINVTAPSKGFTTSITTQYLAYNPNSLTVIYSDKDVYLNNEPIYTTFTPPSLGNTQNQLENLSFNNFIINANSFTQTMIENPDEPLVMLFYNRSLSNSSNTDGLYPIKEKYFYKESIYYDTTNSTDENYTFNYPIFKSGVFFNIGSTYEIKLAKRVYIEEYNTWGFDFFDNSYVFTVSSNVTQDYINQLNQQTATSTDEEREEQLNNSINQQTQSIDNINNTLTDSTVDSSSIDLPTDNTNDPTQSGVDNIFQTIYNSFTSGTALDIVFPIPFTNRNIILQANYIYNMLNNNGASWLISIIQAFWWYIISRFIITDIMKKIRKIKQGNFDNIQNSNIKEDML